MLNAKSGDYQRSGEGPVVTMNRLWFGRDQVMEHMRQFGLPTNLDGTHVIVKGVDESVKWLLATSDPDLIETFIGRSNKFKEALGHFEQATPVVSVRNMMAPGISFDSAGRMDIDGVAMELRFCRKNANDGPLAWLLPLYIDRSAVGMKPSRFTVAVVERSSLGEFMSIMRAADSANRIISVSTAVLNVFNGPDVAIQATRLDDIIMDDSVKSGFVADITAFLERRDWFTGKGFAWTRRYLLEGPPGTGKTLLARWASTALGMPAMSFDFSDPYADGRDLTMCFQVASRRAPCILILDDVDKILDGDNRSSVGKHSILTALSGMGSMDGVIVVATCNSMEQFQGPMRRRFDAVIRVDLPDESLRLEYIANVLNGEDVSTDRMAQLASETDGWSFDDIRALVTAAASNVAVRGAPSISAEDIDRIMPNTTINQDTPTTVQSLIFSKERFKTADAAKAWAKKNNYRDSGVDETQDSWRLRQREPGDFDQDSFKTIELTDGVKAVIGHLKGAARRNKPMGR